MIDSIAGRLLQPDGACARAELRLDAGRIREGGEPSPDALDFGDAILAAEPDGPQRMIDVTAEPGPERLATFPDVLATLSVQSGRIISIANLREGDEVAVVHVPKANVPLGDGVREPSVYPEVEAMLGKPLAEYALA